MKQRETLDRKIIPVELFDMAGLEHWLSDMAAQGLHLVKLNTTPPVPPGRAGPRRPLRAGDHRRFGHRPGAQRRLSGGGLDLCDHPPEPVLCLPDGAVDAPPLHTDPRSRASSGTSCTCSARRAFVRDVFLLVLAAVLTALLLEDTPILHLLTTSAVPLILYGLYQLCSLPAAWAEVQDLSRLVRRLEAGEPMDHRAPYPGGGSSPCCPSRCVCF